MRNTMRIAAIVLLAAAAVLGAARAQASDGALAQLKAQAGAGAAARVVTITAEAQCRVGGAPCSPAEAVKAAEQGVKRDCDAMRGVLQGKTKIVFAGCGDEVERSDRADNDVCRAQVRRACRLARQAGINQENRP